MKELLRLLILVFAALTAINALVFLGEDAPEEQRIQPQSIAAPAMEEPKVLIESRFNGWIQLTDEDMDELASLIWLEARGEPEAGQQAVAEVVLNRVLSADFPDSVHEVIYQDDQFEPAPYMDTAEPTETQYEAIRKAMTGKNIIPDDVVYFATEPENDRVFGKIGSHWFCKQYIWN